MDTQTPSGVLDTGTPSISVDDVSSGSGSQSCSPAMPIIPGHMDSSRPSSGADSGNERPEKGKFDRIGVGYFHGVIFLWFNVISALFFEHQLSMNLIS